MEQINLRKLYPDAYTEDAFVEVSDEVLAVFLDDRRAEEAHERQIYRYKAHYSLDLKNGIENAIIQFSPSPQEVLEEQLLRHQLYSAVLKLPDKQARRIYARYYLGMTSNEIAHAEGVDPHCVRDSIRLGIKNLKKMF